MHRGNLFLNTLALLALLAAGSAHAVLEGQPAENDATARRSTAATSANVTYTEVARTLPSGTRVREYADASGAVFAVSWSGRHKPNLKKLLGRHFESFHNAAAVKERRANLSRLDVDTGDLVVESSGHMGAFEGRAWLQSRLPAGFDPHEMK
jgi:hypothetical protein